MELFWIVCVSIYKINTLNDTVNLLLFYEVRFPFLEGNNTGNQARQKKRLRPNPVIEAFFQN